MKKTELDKKIKFKELNSITQAGVLNWKMKHLQILKQYHKTCPACDFMGIITRIDPKTIHEYSCRCPYCAVFINPPSGKEFGEKKVVKGFDSLGSFYGLCNDVENWYTDIFPVGVFQFYWDMRFGYGVNYSFYRNFVIENYREMKTMEANNINVPNDFMDRKKGELNKMVAGGALYKAVGHINKIEDLDPFIEQLKRSGKKHTVK